MKRTVPAVTLAVALAALGGTTAAAMAQVPAPPAPVPAPPAPPAPAPVPPPVAAALTTSVAGVHRAGGRIFALGGDRFDVRGALAPFVDGQRVVVRLYRGSRKLAARSVAVTAAGFSANFRVNRPGRLTVRVSHRATPQLATLVAKPLRLAVYRATAGAGSRGPVVRLLQAGLDRLRYSVPRNGVYDTLTGHAVMAYRKVNGMARTPGATAALVRGVLAGRGAFKPRDTSAGRHLEADLSRQVLALVDGKRLVRTYSTSSGKPSTPTVQGMFRVYNKTPGTNAKGMVDSSYFIRGYAVHGYASVPVFAASHGCLRIPIANARTVFDWLRSGDRVYVYA